MKDIPWVSKGQGFCGDRGHLSIVMYRDTLIPQPFKKKSFWQRLVATNIYECRERNLKIALDSIW